MLESAHCPEVALGTFASAELGIFPGLVVRGQVAPLRALSEMDNLGDDTMLGLFDRWDSWWPRIAERVAGFVQSGLPGAVPLEAVRLMLPVQPRQIVCAGANYRQHVVEMMTDHDLASDATLDREARHHQAVRMMDHRADKGRPFAFVKPVSTLLAPGEDLVIPIDAGQTDWEVELAVVIGRACHRVSRGEALDHVAGYAIANDISARDRLARRDISNLGLDWIAGKSSPGFFPLGPLIVPAAFVPDPQNLMLTLKLNGQVMQHENTADMIFSISRLIEHITTYMRLLPGDIISTGSPSGNGTHYDRYLGDGDVMEAHIEGLGTQRVRCVGEQLRPGASVHTPFAPLPELAKN